MVQNEKSRTVRVAAVPAFCVSRQRGQFFAPNVTFMPRLMFMLPLLTGMPCGVIFAERVVHADRAVEAFGVEVEQPAER